MSKWESKLFKTGNAKDASGSGRPVKRRESGDERQHTDVLDAWDICVGMDHPEIIVVAGCSFFLIPLHSSNCWSSTSGVTNMRPAKHSGETSSLELPYFPANKPTRRISRGQFLALKMRVFSYYRLISRIRKFRYLTKISLPKKFRYLTLSGMRYIHYAPTHVLYNGGDAGTAW